MQKQIIGKSSEALVKTYLETNDYHILDTHYTIRRWELDIIAEKNNIRILIEVKNVNHTTDLHNYLTPKKLHAITKTFTYYNLTHPTQKDLRVDLVFVRQNTILHHYENITNT